LTTTVTAGSWFVTFRGFGVAANEANGFAGNSAGAINVVGAVIGQNWQFSGALTFSAVGNVFDGCRFVTGSMTGAQPVTMRNCQITTAMTVTDCALSADAFTTNSFMNAGFIPVGAATYTKLDSNKALSTPLSNNQAATSITAARSPAGLYSYKGILDLVASGLGTGTATQNVIYVDRTGATKTVAVCTLLLTAVAGTEGSGAGQLFHNGSAAIQTSVTGAVAGAGLSFVSTISVTKED